MMTFLLPITLFLASPTITLQATDSGGLMPQVVTTTATSLPLPTIPTITLDTLQPPYVSLHSITARGAQAPDPTTTLSPLSFASTHFWTHTYTAGGAHEPTLVTYVYQTANVRSAVHHWTEFPVASSARSFTRAVDTNHTEWDRTALCGALNGDGECGDVSGCVEMGIEHVKGSEMPGLSSAGRVKLSGHF
jgi:hypothetical protein